MYINTYYAKDREELERNIRAWIATLEMLQGLHKRGYRTINEAWRSVCTKQVTKRELDKFAAMLGDKVEARKDSHSWEWFSKWGGNREVSFSVIGESWRDNLKILTVTIGEDLNIGRHYCGNSLNIEEHTIESLILNCEKNVAEYNEALKLFDTIDERVKAYEAELKEAIDQAYNRHIREIDSLVYSRSI